MCGLLCEQLTLLKSNSKDITRKTVFPEASMVTAGGSVVYEQYARAAKVSNV